MTGWDVERLIFRTLLATKRRAWSAVGRGAAPAPLRQWAEVPPLGREVIIAGDSIARRVPATLLSRLSSSPVINHGWGGETTRQVAVRLGTSVGRLPEVLILQVGTNDLLGGASIETTAASYLQMAVSARARLPGCEMVICALPPIARWRCDPKAVRSFNARLRDIAATTEGKFADVFQVLSTPNGTPRREGSIDGVHLSDWAYERYVSVLAATLGGAAQD